MAIQAITQTKFNNQPTFNGSAKKQPSLAKDVATYAGIAGLGLLAYKKNWGSKFLKFLSDNKWMKNKVFPNYEINDAKFMSFIGVTSIVLKDGLGCWMYVRQSLNNDKIPEDKRKFVAALDLANGGLMVGMQLLTFFTISNKKVQEKIFNTLFGKGFTRSANKTLNAMLTKSDKFKGINGKEFHAARQSNLKGLKTAFSYLTSLAAATLLAKRVIVPFIATPLADKTKAWMSRNDKPATTHKDTKNTYDVNAGEKPKNDQTQFAGSTTTNLLDAAKNKSNAIS